MHPTYIYLPKRAGIQNSSLHGWSPRLCCAGDSCDEARSRVWLAAPRLKPVVKAGETSPAWLRWEGLNGSMGKFCFVSPGHCKDTKQSQYVSNLYMTL